MSSFESIISTIFVAIAGASAASAEPTHNVTLQPYVGSLLTVDTTVDGHPARMLFDTGGGLTLVSPELAAATGCNPHGRLVGFRMTGERVTSRKCGEVDVAIGTFRQQIRPGVFDIMALLPESFPRIDGVISRDLLEDEIVTLDLADGTLVIGRPVLTKGSEGEMRLMREIGGAGLTVFARAHADTGSLYLLADSGNSGAFVLSPGAIAQLGKQSEIGSNVRVPLRLDGTAPQSVEAKVEDVIYDGALNYCTLAQHRITLDLKAERIWFAPTHGTRPPACVEQPDDANGATEN